jgi:hypothetical protein
MDPAIISCATCTTDFPHAAVSPVKLSPVPAGFSTWLVFLEALITDSVVPAETRIIKPFICAFQKYAFLGLGEARLYTAVLFGFFSK